MQWAILTSAGGQPIHASKADYSDYKGFLKCEECRKPVFLRKEHQRKGYNVQAAFIHQEAIPEISICEKRVGKYNKERVEQLATKAKGQRLNKLKVSMWKYLKRNITANLKDWSKYVNDAKKIGIIG